MIVNGPLRYVLQVVDYKIRLNSIMVYISCFFWKVLSFIIKVSNSLHGHVNVLYSIPFLF